MQDIKTQIHHLLRHALNTLGADHVAITLEKPNHAAHGDFSSNVALTLAKPLHTSPRVIAEKIVQNIPVNTCIAHTEIAGAGFINFFVSAQAWQSIIPVILRAKHRYGRNTVGHHQAVQVEFVSANPTGPLHVGHGRGAVIGDCLARLLSFNGWRVTREFYYNDAGAQIEQLVRSVKAHLDGIPPHAAEFPQDGYRGAYIADIALAFQQKSTVQASDRVVTANGDSKDLEAIREFSVAYLRQEQDMDLRAFGVNFDVFSLETALYANGEVAHTVAKLIDSGYTYEQEGALWLRTTALGDDKDRVMRKANGEYTYFVPDVAYHLNKWRRGFTRVINEQGADHHSTITRVRAGLQAMNLGIPIDWPEYVLHQMVTVLRAGSEVKISKRAGDYVTLRDLIDEVGVSATRYFLVSRRADSQLVFDIDLARANTSDNPVFYIQYAHARICSVLAEWGGDIRLLHSADMSLLDQSLELEVMKRLSHYPELIQSACHELSPHLIAHYLKDLAGDFHRYYNTHKFLTTDKRITLARISLIRAVQHVLRNGLFLLGITPKRKM